MFTHPSTTDSVQVPNHRLTKKRDVVAYKNRAFSAVKKPCGAFFDLLLKRLLRRIIGLHRLRHNRASRVTALVVGRLGRYDSGDVATREAREDANE